MTYHQGEYDAFMVGHLDLGTDDHPCNGVDTIRYQRPSPRSTTVINRASNPKRRLHFLGRHVGIAGRLRHLHILEWKPA